jgi:citrate lyase beta subunit
VRDRYLTIRSIMESPILDDRKWAKVPDLDADCIMVDLEDSVPEAGKDAARAKAAAHLRTPDFFRGKLILARPNHLSTPWGRDDLAALGEAGVGCVAYPKVNAVQDIDEALAVLTEHGAAPDIFAIIETAGSVLNVAAIAAHPKVKGLMFGPGDLSVDSGISLFSSSGELNDAFLFPKVATVLAGVSAGVLTADIAFLRNIKDLDEARAKYSRSRELGFTAGITFYPPHIAVVNSVFGPTEPQLEKAENIIQTYEKAVAEGQTAVVLDNGQVLLVHDYEKALVLRERALAIGLGGAMK